MSRSLLSLLSGELTVRLGALGFEPMAFRVSAVARRIYKVSTGGLGFARLSPERSMEFLYFNRGTERYSISCFAGWNTKPTLPGPSQFAYFPSSAHELIEQSLGFPFFLLRTPEGHPVNTQRTEGDEWFLVASGPMPLGKGDDAQLSELIVQTLACRLASSEALECASVHVHVSALASRIAEDVRVHYMPFLNARRNALAEAQGAIASANSTSSEA